MLKRRTLTFFIFIAFLLIIGIFVFFSVMKNKQFQYDYAHLMNNSVRGAATEFIGGASLVPGMELASENDILQLAINTNDMSIAVHDKRTGYTWYSTPPELNSISSKEAGDMKSTFILTYYNANDRKFEINSFVKSIEFDQAELMSIENGVRIMYTIGDVTLGVDFLPDYISFERMEEMILSKLDDPAEVRFVTRRYMETKSKEGFFMAIPALKSNKLDVERMIALFIRCGYTEEDLMFDNLDADHEMELNRASVSFPVEYVLEGDTLVMNIALEEMIERDGAKLWSFDVHKYFGAGTMSEEGYMLVPSGSGALIDFNSFRPGRERFYQPVYGPDPVIQAHTQQIFDVRLPVFGIKKAEGAFVVSMENGEAFAFINSLTPGMQINYNIVYPTFVFRTSDWAGVLSVDYGHQYAGFARREFIERDVYQGDVTLAYMFLPGDVDYSDMAARYQKRLVDTGRLTKKTEAGDTPFYMDIIGSVEKRVAFLGAPYTTSIPMTTNGLAGEIAKVLNNSGINNILMRYIGWFNAGISHDVARHLRLISEVGKSKDLQNLQTQMNNTGGKLFPDIAVLETKLMSRNFNYRNETGMTAAGWIGFSDIVENMNRATFGYRGIHFRANNKYITNPNIVPEIVDKYIANSKKHSIMNVSLRDMGNYLAADQFDRANVNRDVSKRISMDSMRKMNERFDNVLIRGGYMYSLIYADYLYDVPMFSDTFNILAKEIPFYQMVVHGYIDYCGNAYNTNEVYDPVVQLLRMIEYGASPRFIFSYEETSNITMTAFEHFFSTHYVKWYQQSVDIYRAYNDVHKNLRDKKLIGHDELAPGVFRTNFEGNFVYVNYTKHDVEVDGITVPSFGYYNDAVGAKSVTVGRYSMGGGA
ncbi:MAG: DUF5696 domain-containing protein [Defluviitaleaceae bacterium]|nr:DUF5696 domain-containing protein [Defluviitaleaceae bacterium]